MPRINEISILARLICVWWTAMSQLIQLFKDLHNLLSPTELWGWIMARNLCWFCRQAHSFVPCSKTWYCADKTWLYFKSGHRACNWCWNLQAQDSPYCDIKSFLWQRNQASKRIDTSIYSLTLPWNNCLINYIFCSLHTVKANWTVHHPQQM